jgi:2-iminobutanoate/2-iminopropanoate deaminase
MKKEIRTDKAPLPIGPYSQAVVSGNLVFISGVLPIDINDNNKLIKEVEPASKLIFSHLESILKATNLTKENIVKATVFLKSMNNFQTVNTVYKEYFKDVKVFPARSAVEVSKLPLDSEVEIEFIAVI